MRILILIQEFLVHLSQTFISCLRILLQSNFKGILKTSKLQENRLLILGNGPSLKDSLEKFDKLPSSNLDLMAVNAFATTSYYNKLKPKYYIINAVTYFQKDEEMSPFYIELRKTLFQHLLEDTLWDLYLMVPFRAKKSKEFQELISQNKHLHPIYFNQTPGEGFQCFTKLVYSRSWAIPRPHNVLIPAIMNSLYLGFKEIIIIGADHSWLSEISVNEKNEALVHQKHYYDEQSSRPEKVQDYITRPRRLHEILHKYYLSFQGYWDIEQYSRKRGATIYNSSEISLIDAFERKSLEELTRSRN